MAEEYQSPESGADTGPGTNPAAIALALGKPGRMEGVILPCASRAR